jgi:DNA-binding PadR family transcriptional regulator
MGLVGRGGASGPELVQMATGAAPLFWTGGGSHVLREARRLADHGYLSTRTEPAKTRPRTLYELTDNGREAMRDWIASPSSYPRIQHEAAIRVFVSDLGNTDDLLNSLTALRDQLPYIDELCDRFEQRAPRSRTAPKRSRLSSPPSGGSSRHTATGSTKSNTNSARQRNRDRWQALALAAGTRNCTRAVPGPVTSPGSTRGSTRSRARSRAYRAHSRPCGLGEAGLQPLLLDKVHNRHDRGRPLQLDAELPHDRTEVRQELVERLLALPDVEHLKPAILAEA